MAPSASNAPPTLDFTATDCPWSPGQINDYLDLEDLDRQRENLAFFFRADHGIDVVWVWRYLDLRGRAVYVVMTQARPTDHPEMLDRIGCGPANELGNDPVEVANALRLLGYLVGPAKRPEPP